jgi:hypothetical protein
VAFSIVATIDRPSLAFFSGKLITPIIPLNTTEKTKTTATTAPRFLLLDLVLLIE